MNLEKVDNELLNEYRMLLEIPETRECLLHKRDEVKIVFRSHIEKYNENKLKCKQEPGQGIEDPGGITISLDPVEEKKEGDNIISMYMNEKQFLELLSDKEASDFFSCFCLFSDYRQMILHEFESKVKPLLKEQRTTAKAGSDK